MRPRNETARDQLQLALARRPAARAGELAEVLGVSLATLHRLLGEQGHAVVSTGKARRTRYALRRTLRGELAELPLYAIDSAGQAHPVAQLALIHPQGSRLSLAGTPWPVPEDSRDGWWGGLPYPLCDMRPQGYLGRQLARAQHLALGVPGNPDEWGDDDVAHVLSRAGEDVTGNLILGNPAFEAWQAHKVATPPVKAPLKARAVPAAYVRLAEQAVATGVPGSSAAGEFPKFPALRELPGSETPHVLVKFSGAERSSAVQRWADLLVCEHLALECGSTLPGVASARSRIVQHGGRTFLEVERFDRHGAFGRSPLVSLGTLDAALLGDRATDWTRLAHRLHAAGWLATEEVQRIEHLWWFGRLIANSDMHTGNLSFQPERVGGAAPGLRVAPAYDMQPMLYAPLPGGEVPARTFAAPLPLPAQRGVWRSAATAALEFWRLAAGDARISEGFRGECRRNERQLQVAVQRV